MEATCGSNPPLLPVAAGGGDHRAIRPELLVSPLVWLANLQGGPDDLSASTGRRPRITRVAPGQQPRQAGGSFGEWRDAPAKDRIDELGQVPMIVATDDRDTHVSMPGVGGDHSLEHGSKVTQGSVLPASSRLDGERPGGRNLGWKPRVVLP